MKGRRTSSTIVSGAGSAYPWMSVHVDGRQVEVQVQVDVDAAHGASGQSLPEFRVLILK